MIPDTQTAIQLVGPDQLARNDAKPVPRPGPRQILGRVECTGLCFSDMKLLHQFDQHARKGPVLAQLTDEVLAQIPSYVPDDAPTVPGHEAVLTVVAVGEGVGSVQVGKRYLVQADWRELRTKGSNGAFGYNFEGGLQQYVLLDERCTLASDGSSYLLPVEDGKSVSATALVEPWACVEQAFIHRERQSLKAGGTLLLVQCAGLQADLTGLDLSASARRLCICNGQSCPAGFEAASLDALAPASIDDICFVGADADLLERVFPLAATDGLVLIATAGGRFGREVVTPIGRVHYGNVRLVGSPSAAPAQALARIPATGELRPGDLVHVIGAAGPMGSMVTIRCVSLGLAGTSVHAGDMSAERLVVLERKVAATAAAKGITCRVYNGSTEAPPAEVDYAVVMVPVGALVAQALCSCRAKGVINIFAGIPAEVSHAVDLDRYVERGLYFIGTSGSTMEDIHAVLRKVEAGELDTNLSVAAVSGFAGAIPGLEAVRDGKVAGKILVYPQLGDLPLTTLEELVAQRPEIGPLLADGNWTKAAEDALLGRGRGAR